MIVFSIYFKLRATIFRFVPMAARPMVRGSDVIVNIVNYVVFPLFSKSKFSDSSTNLMSTTDAIFSKQNSKAVNYVITSLQLTNQASFLK